LRSRNCAAAAAAAFNSGLIARRGAAVGEDRLGVGAVLASAAEHLLRPSPHPSISSDTSVMQRLPTTAPLVRRRRRLNDGDSDAISLTATAPATGRASVLLLHSASDKLTTTADDADSPARSFVRASAEVYPRRELIWPRLI